MTTKQKNLFLQINHLIKINKSFIQIFIEKPKNKERVFLLNFSHTHTTHIIQKKTLRLGLKEMYFYLLFFSNEMTLAPDNKDNKKNPDKNISLK